MPLYEYKCEACGQQFEVIQKFSDPLLVRCPKCGSGPVQKLISPPAIQFKGSGWYITDYARKDSGASAPKSDTAASSDTSAKSDKTETKTEKSEKKDKKTESTASPKAAADRAK
jgi:putative FmdB family regulatory protein